VGQGQETVADQRIPDELGCTFYEIWRYTYRSDLSKKQGSLINDGERGIRKRYVRQWACCVSLVKCEAETKVYLRTLTYPHQEERSLLVVSSWPCIMQSGEPRGLLVALGHRVQIPGDPETKRTRPSRLRVERSRTPCWHQSTSTANMKSEDGESSKRA
jgi:hypothetical protein